MDINGTKFHLLTGGQDWEPLLKHPQTKNLWWDDERANLSLTPKILHFPKRSQEDSLTPQNRRGSACDQYGNIFWISEDNKEIRILPSGENKSGKFWSVEDLGKHCNYSIDNHDFHPAEKKVKQKILELHGLAVTGHHYLVTGTREPAGLLIFDLHAGGPPTILNWPSENFFPVDMAPAPQNGLWILDSKPGSGTSLYWCLDRFFRVIVPQDLVSAHTPSTVNVFEPSDPSIAEKKECYRQRKITIDMGISVPVKDAVSIEGLTDGTVLILGSSSSMAYSEIYRFRLDKKLNTIALEGDLLEGMMDEGVLKAHDFVFIYDSNSETGIVRGRLTVVAEDGNQAYLFSLAATDEELSLSLRPLYLPLRRYGGKALIPVKDFVYYDFEEKWLPLTPQPRQRFQSEGSVEGIIIDSEKPDCIWHRMTLDACIPDGTAIWVETRAANDKNEIAHQEPFKEPTPHLRSDGSEIAFHEPFTHKELGHKNIGTWDLLFQKAKGRYLELKLKLVGNGQLTPRIRAVRVYYPRFSYLDNYLPAVYRSNHDSVNIDKNRFHNYELVEKLLNKQIIRGFDRNPDYVYFNDSITNEDDLKNFLDNTKSFTNDEVEFILTVWRQSRADPSANFLDRFLCNMEGFYSTIEGRIAKADALFDIRTSPAEYLKWLAGWVGSALDSEWDDYRQRLFIANAVLLYRWRGTKIGLRASIRLACDPCPDESIFEELKGRYEYRPGALGGYSVRIIENFNTRKFLGVVLGDPRVLEGPSLIPVNDVFSPVSGGETISQRYRDFLHRIYEGETERETLDQINQAWGRDHNSFDQIIFSRNRPSHVIEAGDWLAFIRYEVDINRPWTPQLGSYSLHVRFREFLRRQYSDEDGDSKALEKINNNWKESFKSFDDILFSPVVPKEEAIAEDWLRFTQQALGFTYAGVTTKYINDYQDFLARRYHNIDSLNKAYGLVGDQKHKSFSSIPLPDEKKMPADGMSLVDWIQFVSLTIPIKQNAHRFTVLVPTVPGENQQSRYRRLGKVKTIVEREKPAHTSFSIEFYWALFQVGSARVGLDTVIGGGNRYVAMVLGINYLGQSFLAKSHPWNVDDRNVVGRDSLLGGLKKNERF